MVLTYQLGEKVAAVLRDPRTSKDARGSLFLFILGTSNDAQGSFLVYPGGIFRCPGIYLPSAKVNSQIQDTVILSDGILR